MLVPFVDKFNGDVRNLPVAPSPFNVVLQLEGAQFSTVLRAEHLFFNIERVRGESDEILRALSHLIVLVVDVR